MKCKAAVRITVAMLALVISSQAAVPMLLSHQGRLLDSSDQPVTGTRDMIFHIYDVETGGAPLWSETHFNVSVEDGLFHVTLGGTVTISADMLVTSGPFDPTKWLEVSVAGSTLSPRMRLGTSPFAVAATRVSGDVETSAARLKAEVSDPDNDAGCELGVVFNHDWTFLTLKDSSKTDNSSTKISWTSNNNPIASIDNAVGRMEIDDDGDGVPESELMDEVTSNSVNREIKRMGGKIAMRLDSSGSSLELLDSSSTTGASVKGSWTSTQSPIGTVSGGALTMEVDNDGDGHSEANSNIAALLNGNTVIGCATDADDDGVPEFSNELSSSPTGVSHKLVWNSALDLGSVPNKEVVLRITPSDGFSGMTVDSDGDGVQEKNVGLYVSDVSGQAGVRSSYDSDDDGVPEAETELSTSSSGVVHKFAWNSAADLGAEPNLKWNINLNPTGNDVTGLMSSDVDGDGNSEQELSLKVLDVSSQINLNSKDGVGNQKSKLGGHAATDYALLELERFIDTDTIPDIGISSSASTDRAILESFFERGDKPTQSQFANLLDSDGITSTFDSHNGSTTGTIRMMASPDSVDEISTIGDGSSSSTSSMRLRLNELEAKLQNIGILARTTVTQACDDTSASISIKRNDGPDTPIAMEIQDLTTSPLRVSHRLALDGDVDGIADKQILLDCDDDDAGLAILAGVAIPKFIDITARDAGTLPGSTSDVSLVMGMGVDSLLEFRGDDSETSLSLSSVSDNSRIYIIDDNTGVSMSVTPPTSGTYQFEVTVTDATGLVRLRDAAGNVSLDLDADGRLGVGGAAHATNPIHHSSGAHLTVGGDWTNASDKDLKENFTKIDGKELLEKIEELPISQWNYKNEDESVVHIGPTAQDFQKAFGVGSNDKTISTIDPSGIALAAIKELNKQNRDLTKQNDELKKELESLKKKVDELISRK